MGSAQKQCEVRGKGSASLHTLYIDVGKYTGAPVADPWLQCNFFRLHDVAS